MKKKILIASLLATSVLSSALALTACADPNAGEHKCGSVCPTCQKCTSECKDDVCKDKCEGHGSAVTPSTVDMTQGVYNCKMGSYDLLIKFYDEDTFYFQNEMKGYRGKYEIKDEDVTHAKTQPDGSDYNSADHPDKAGWVTSKKAIYFYKEDGVTPIDYAVNKSEPSAHDANTVVSGVCYAYGTPANVLAYNAEEDKIQSFRGDYGSRTLSHTTGRDFKITDEKAIIQAEFMPKNVPADAEAGKVESDYFLRLSQKGYETNIPEIQALGFEAGKFTVNADGTEYKITDTLSSAKGTITVTEKGATLTLDSDTTKKVDLLVWEEVVSYAAKITNDKGLTLSINEDGTFKLKGSITLTGTYTYTDSELALEFDENGNGASVTAATVQGDDISVTIAVTSPASMSFKFDGKVTGKLYTPAAQAMLKVASEEAVFGSTKVDLELMDDCTLVLSVGGQEKATAFWYLNTETKEITFKKSSAGAFTYSLNNYQPWIKWTGRFSDSETEDKTYTFNIAAQDLGKLVGAQVKAKLTVSASVEKLNNQELTLTLFADGTLSVAHPRLTVATGEWSLGLEDNKPKFTFTNVSAGEFTPGYASQTEYKINWTGDINMGSSVSVSVDFKFLSSELSGLL